MNEQRQMLAETVERLFADIGTSTHGPDDVARAWQQMSELGITELFCAEEAGGFGGNWQDAFVVLRAAGLFALPVPVAETLAARKLLADTGVAAPDGPLTIALAASSAISEGRRVDACLPDMAWDGVARHVLTAVADGQREYLVLLDIAGANARREHVAARGEPRSELNFVQVSAVAVVERDHAGAELRASGALIRAAQTAGALEAALNLSIQHVNERVQFGRSLSKFQAIQHQMALLAEEVAAVGCAAQAACLALDRGDARLAIAAAKLRANRSVQQATSIAHQVHGAIGFTREHRLHLFTQRLWHWRRDFGNDRFWAAELGRLAHAGRESGLWSLITG